MVVADRLLGLQDYSIALARAPLSFLREAREVFTGAAAAWGVHYDAADTDEANLDASQLPCLGVFVKETRIQVMSVAELEALEAKTVAYIHRELQREGRSASDGEQRWIAEFATPTAVRVGRVWTSNADGGAGNRGILVNFVTRRADELFICSKGSVSLMQLLALCEQPEKRESMMLGAVTVVKFFQHGTRALRARWLQLAPASPGDNPVAPPAAHPVAPPVAHPGAERDGLEKDAAAIRFVALVRDDGTRFVPLEAFLDMRWHTGAAEVTAEEHAVWDSGGLRCILPSGRTCIVTRSAARDALFAKPVPEE